MFNRSCFENSSRDYFNHTSKLLFSRNCFENSSRDYFNHTTSKLLTFKVFGFFPVIYVSNFVGDYLLPLAQKQ